MFISNDFLQFMLKFERLICNTDYERIIFWRIL